MALTDIIQQAKDIAKQAVLGVQAVCDHTLGDVEIEIPKLTGEALDLAKNLIVTRLGNVPFASELMNALEGGIKPVLDHVDVAVVAGVHILKTDVDSALGHIETALT